MFDVGGERKTNKESRNPGRRIVKEELRRKKEEGRRKKEEGRRKREGCAT